MAEVIKLVVNNERRVKDDDPANWPQWKKEIAMSLGHPARIFEPNEETHDE